jgi:hypothetical protein
MLKAPRWLWTKCAVEATREVGEAKDKHYENIDIAEGSRGRCSGRSGTCKRAKPCMSGIGRIFKAMIIWMLALGVPGEEVECKNMRHKEACIEHLEVPPGCPRSARMEVGPCDLEARGHRWGHGAAVLSKDVRHDRGVHMESYEAKSEHQRAEEKPMRRQVWAKCVIHLIFANAFIGSGWWCCSQVHGRRRPSETNSRWGRRSVRYQFSTMRYIGMNMKKEFQQLVSTAHSVLMGSRKNRRKRGRSCFLQCYVGSGAVRRWCRKLAKRCVANGPLEV